jgi:hypothetical protein
MMQFTSSVKDHYTCGSQHIMDGMYRRRSWMAFGFHSSLVTSSSILDLCFCFAHSDADISIAESVNDHNSPNHLCFHLALPNPRQQYIISLRRPSIKYRQPSRLQVRSHHFFPCQSMVLTPWPGPSIDLLKHGDGWQAPGLRFGGR